MYNYDRRIATNADFLRGRSGWELRVIGEFSAEYEGLVPDPLETAALAVDNVKKKHGDIWRAMMESNLAPKAVADVLGRMKDEALRVRLAAGLTPEETKAVKHLTEAQRKGLDEADLAKVAKGILRIQKDGAVKRAKGKNPYASRPFNNPSNSFDINFLAPNSRGEMRVYTWTGDSLSAGDRVESKTFATEAEANEEIRTKVLNEIRRYHPGDDVFILEW